MTDHAIRRSLENTEDEAAHHLCIVCGAYGPRSPDFGKTRFCQQHDPHRDKDLKLQTSERPPGPSWDPCQCCDGQGCPWCRPELHGLPPRKQLATTEIEK